MALLMGGIVKKQGRFFTLCNGDTLAEIRAALRSRELLTTRFDVTTQRPNH